MTTITKKTTLLAPEVIAQTSDGQLKVYKVSDNGQSAVFDLDNMWDVKGVGFLDKGWAANSCALYLAPGGANYEIRYHDMTDTSFKLKLAPGESKPAAGNYPNAMLYLGFEKESSEQLEIQIHLVVK